jgi:hypothetical protein
MGYKVEERSAPGRDKVQVLGETFEEGEPRGEDIGKWRHKFDTREESLKYLQSAERYWYAKEVFGSEKRRNPA